MLNRNSVLAGIFIALVSPAVAFEVAYLLNDNMFLLNKPALPYLAAIALNLILMRLLAKKELDKMVKGIMITTFMLMIVLFIFKLHPIR